MSTRTHKPLPSAERLRELFSYDPETGVVTVQKTTPNRKAGTTAGALQKSGYLAVSVDNKAYMLHRIIWLLHYNEDPSDNVIDHIDHDRTNNRIDNLRLVSNQQNLFNRKSAKGFTRKPGGKFMAQIMLDGKGYCLGRYTCPLMARLAYEDAKSELHKIS